MSVCPPESLKDTPSLKYSKLGSHLPESCSSSSMPCPSPCSPDKPGRLQALSASKPSPPVHAVTESTCAVCLAPRVWRASSPPSLQPWFRGSLLLGPLPEQPCSFSTAAVISWGSEWPKTAPSYYITAQRLRSDPPKAHLLPGFQSLTTAVGWNAAFPAGRLTHPLARG